MIGTFKEVTETLRSRFTDCPLGKQLEEETFDSFTDVNNDSLDAYVIDYPIELCDDNDKPYRTVDGKWFPNNTFVLEDVSYKTDDNGKIYCTNGKLHENTSYELNGNIYHTDDQGRIIACEAKPVRSPENPRDNEAQRQAGGTDRRPGDQGGHIVGRDMNGDSGIGNLIAMDSKINQSDFKRMENDIKAALDENQNVSTKTEISYNGQSERPDEIIVTLTLDDKEATYIFDNNLEGALDGEITEISTTAKDIIDEYPGAHVSSIKKEFNDDGSLIRTVAYITYKDEDGFNCRTPVIIANQ